MPVEKLKSFLDEHGVKYVTIKHSKAFTAQQIAASAHVPGKEMAKTVMIKINGDMAMAVLPAPYKVDLEKLQDATGADTLILAEEEEFKTLFPDCEVGAMPPFGNLYGMDVFMAASLADDEQIAFNAGTHTELIKMSFADYVDLVDPVTLRFALETA
jgi:Ala-tRNA(Pro) deacylase